MPRINLQCSIEQGYPTSSVFNPDYEVDYLAQLLQVSTSLVIEAITSAGTNRHKVKKYIKKALHKHRK